MNQKKGLSVKGLANIGTILDRGELPVMEAPKADKPMTPLAIAQRAWAATQHGTHIELRKDGFFAAVQDAYQQGRSEGLAQSGHMEKLLNEQYASRISGLVPAVVAAVMEQIGMTELVLDMDAVKTVFNRCAIDYTGSIGVAGDFVTYKLAFKADVVPQ